MPPKPAVSDGGFCSACAAACAHDLLHLSMHVPFPLALDRNGRQQQKGSWEWKDGRGDCAPAGWPAGQPAGQR